MPKISALPENTTDITGSEQVPLLDGSITKRENIDDIVTYIESVINTNQNINVESSGSTSRIFWSNMAKAIDNTNAGTFQTIGSFSVPNGFMFIPDKVLYYINNINKLNPILSSSDHGFNIIPEIQITINSRSSGSLVQTFGFNLNKVLYRSEDMGDLARIREVNLFRTSLMFGVRWEAEGTTNSIVENKVLDQTTTETSFGVDMNTGLGVEPVNSIDIGSFDGDKDISINNRYGSVDGSNISQIEHKIGISGKFIPTPVEPTQI